MIARRLHPFLDHPRPTGFAHRGGSLEAEENTMPAFERAVALGFTHVELDVHATRDGVVVVHHDDTLARMFGAPQRVDDLTWADLQTLRTAGGATIPRLSDLLGAFPTLNVNIETKSMAVVAPLAQVITRANALDRICIGSFQPERTAAARTALGPGLCWSPAHAGVARLWLAGWGLPIGAGDFPVVQVPPRFRGLDVVTPRFVRAAHARGILVQVWTVDDAAEMERLIAMGVDGIMTDRPSVLKQVLARHAA
ncbi:MAG: glycerophosphodiester phosphodiesterase [Gemmobacter sp.]|nr:glycerophosphodiester phosphodiesterase [Gemmobacter sp.]